jgi:hypothetical protein
MSRTSRSITEWEAIGTIGFRLTGLVSSKHTASGGGPGKVHPLRREKNTRWRQIKAFF